MTALVLAFIGAVWFYSAQQEKTAADRAAANMASLMRDHAPTLGPADAPVVIVEFLDPACETCREFYPLVKQMMAANPDRIRLVMRYAPFHNGSDKVVAVLEAARRQGKLWPALETLFASQEQWVVQHTARVDFAWKAIEGLGLNMEQMAFDVTDPQIARLIEQDLADARTLNVTQTPEFFVNGKPLPSFGAEQLKKLVDDALASSTAHRK
ncbi:MAG TPA: thioredoxin domain-containing protein [Aromatoleum sp.]|uniref:DsbA family protein n=1 Tax=Aromatoleum sp. TaxID=2307007 RepID=UPI002B47C1B8|nr:thioredoxin domain-containing protein [Aromatoleum sp.]HJV25898.1 thioredoxin domain-containing protein [Aromatoleum sp.]